MLVVGVGRRCLGLPSMVIRRHAWGITLLVIQILLQPMCAQTAFSQALSVPFSPSVEDPRTADRVLPRRSLTPAPEEAMPSGCVFENSPPSDLATEVRQILPWFPIDTEAITVVRTPLRNPHSAQVDAELERAVGEPFEEIMGRDLIMALLRAEFLGRDRGVIDRHVFSGKPLLIVSMARYVGHIITRQQACVLRFDRPSSMFEELRRYRVVEHFLHGRLVLEGVCSHRPDPVLHSSSLYFVSLTPETLLVTSHLLLVKDILHRVSQPKANAAVSPALLEWRHVNYRCSAWGIRVHPSKARSRNRTDEQNPTSSFTMWYDKSRERVTIRCIDQEGKAGEVLERLFVTRGLDRVPRKIMTSPDGQLADVVFPVTRNLNIGHEATAVLLHSYDAIMCPLLLGTHSQEQLPF